ncbi:undecaprenyl-diphosphate phosphatase [bacterium]|nr:undecaprenyl-diphosphate phosphatase [bacterium]
MRDAVILGVVQGITEWLPVSSSGHLVLFQKFLNLKGGISFDIFLHFSSLLVIFIFFWEDIKKVAKGFFSFKKELYEFKLGCYIIVSSLITAIIGIPLNFCLEKITFLLPFAFFFTSLLLFLSRVDGEKRMDFKRAVLIGFIQGISLIPGISRSGATISTARISGVSEKDAFRYSFLIAIPSFLGAVLIKLKDFKFISPSFLLTGFLISFITGIFSLYLLRKIVYTNKLYLFGFYTLMVGIFSFFV